MLGRYWVEPVLSNGDEVFCSKTQHCIGGGILTHLLVTDQALYQLSLVTGLDKQTRKVTVTWRMPPKELV